MQNQNNTNLNNMNYNKYNNSRDQTARSYTDHRENNDRGTDMSQYNNVRDYRAGFAERRGNEDRPTRLSNFLNNSQDNNGGEYAGHRGVEDCGDFRRNCNDSRDGGLTDRRGNRGTFTANYSKSSDYTAVGFPDRRGNDDHRNNDNRLELMSNFSNNSQDYNAGNRRGIEHRSAFASNFNNLRDYNVEAFADRRVNEDRGAFTSNFSNDSRDNTAKKYLNRDDFVPNYNNLRDHTVHRLADRRGNEDLGAPMFNFSNDSRNNTVADRRGIDDRDAFRTSNYNNLRDYTARGNKDCGENDDRLPNNLKNFRDYIAGKCSDRSGCGDRRTLEPHYSNNSRIYRTEEYTDRKSVEEVGIFQTSNHNNSGDYTSEDCKDNGEKVLKGNLKNFRDYITRECRDRSRSDDRQNLTSNNSRNYDPEDYTDRGENDNRAALTSNFKKLRDYIAGECTATSMNDDLRGKDGHRTKVNIGHVGGWYMIPRLPKTPTEGLLQPRVRCRNRLPFIPRVGEPGGLDDRRRIGLSGAGIRWYLRFLDEGYEPDEARRLAGEKRTKEEPTSLHARLMRKRSYVPIIPSEVVPPVKVKKQRIESPTRKKERLVAKTARLFERYLPHLKLDEQKVTAPENAEKEIVKPSSSDIPKKKIKNNKVVPILPALGEPGGLDDPRRRALSGAGNRWYLRYLGRGIEPNKAWKMALDRRTKPIPADILKQADSNYMSPSEDDEERETERRTSTTSESSRNNANTKKFAALGKRTDGKLPPLGKPGARDDPRRKGLSGAGNKWYIRFLKQGFEPDEARKKAEEKRSPSNHTKIIVLPKEFPNESLVTEELEILQECIMKEVSLNRGQKLIFDGIHLKPGMLLVVCASPETAEWLKSKTSKLSTWNGVQLMARLEEDIPPACIINVCLPISEHQDDNLNMISVIKKQNPELNTKTWKILSNRKQSKGQSVMILIDKQSFETIKNGDGTIHYKLERIRVKGIKRQMGNTEAQHTHSSESEGGAMGKED